MVYKKRSLFSQEILKEYQYAPYSEVEDSIFKLDQSFKKWSKLTTVERQKKLKPVLNRMKEKHDLIAKKITDEMGKPILQSILELEKCILTTERALQMDLSFLDEVQFTSVYSKSLVKHEALGVIYSIMPWNYPLWQAIRMMIPALLSGNTILLKHSEITPEVGIQIEVLFQGLFEADLVKNLMFEHQYSESILADSRVGGVSLTGSTQAGLTLAQISSRYLKKSVLELGGSDPYLVFSDADLELSAKLITQSRLQNTGQSCIAAKRCLVHSSVLVSFLEILKVEFSKYKFGDLFETTTTLGPLADQRFKNNYSNQMKELSQKTKIKNIFKIESGFCEDSAYVDAEILLLSENYDYLKANEFFGPLLCVMPFETEVEAIILANSTQFGLGGGVFSKNIELAHLVASQIQAGQIAINDIIKTELNLPFGGTKLSGMGRELGLSGFTEFTQTKVISFS